MNEEALRAVVFQTLETEWAAKQPGVPIAYENSDFQQPSGPWIHIALIPNISVRAEVSSAARFHHLGVINVTCMVVAKTGTKKLREMAEDVFSILADRNWSVGDHGKLTTYGAEHRQRGEINGYYVRNVMMEYRLTDKLIR